MKYAFVLLIAQVLCTMQLSVGLITLFYFILFCSVGFYQMAKIAVTPTIVLAEFVFFRKRVSCQKVTAPYYPIVHEDLLGLGSSVH